jgi:hypothetical protein
MADQKSAVRSPEELALIGQAKQRLQVEQRWTEPQAYAWLRCAAMNGRMRLVIVSCLVLQAPAGELPELPALSSSATRKTRRQQRTRSDGPPPPKS